jgi:U3 small nucleolar RNA-associated protein 14
MKKIQGQSSDSEVDSDSDPEVTRQKLQEMAEELDEKPEPMVKGVMGMKFMQKALEAERQEAKKRILDMQREFEEEAALGEELDALEEGKALPSQPIAVVRNNNPGRMQFGPTSTKSKSVDKGEKDEYYDRSSDDDDEQPATTEGSATARIVNLDHGVQVDEFNKSASKKISVSGPIDIGSIPLNTPMLNPPSDSKKISFSTFTSPAVETENNDDMIKQVDTVDDEDNPWMAPIDGLSGLSTLANTAGSRKYDETDHQRAAKSKQKMLKNVLKQEKKQQQEVLDQLESAIPEETMDGSDDSNDEITHVASRNQISFFSQKELIQMAFANDDVLEQEFMNEKEAIMDADAPKGVDVTLPGWGSWGGVDAPQPRKRFVLPPKPGAIDPSKRKDKPLKHVIINEQMDKKMTQYMCQKVPFPYKSREQYEAMMRNPVGKEWNAAHVFSKQIKPRILTKMGATIAPPKFVKIEKE